MIREEQYTIIEDNLGPLISHSRSSVYDVLEWMEKGKSPAEIGAIRNLKPGQVQVALGYITEHRERLLLELHEILEKKAERQAYHLARQAELYRDPADMPPSPLRDAFLALRAKARAQREPQS